MAKKRTPQRAQAEQRAQEAEPVRFERRKKAQPRLHSMSLRFTYDERVRLEEIAQKLGHASATDYLRVRIERMLEDDEKKLGASGRESSPRG